MTTEIALRPRSVSELLDAAIQILKRHYAAFVVIAGVAYLPIIALQIASAILRARMPSPLADPSGGEFSTASIEFILIGFVTAVVIMVWSTVAEGAIVTAASEAYMGQSVTPRSVLGNAFRRTGTLLGASILRTLLVMVGVGVVAVPLMLLGAIVTGFSPILGALLGVPALIGIIFAGFYVYMGLLTIPAAVVLEKNGVSDALSRSWQLSSGLRWKALGAWILAFIIIILTSMTVQVLFALLKMPIVAPIAGSVLQIFVYPLIGIVVTLLYYDARIRKEGLDLELMARGLTGPVGSQPAS